MPEQESYLKGLNQAQIDAVLDSQSVLLIACPGSGKTRTLTSKIAQQLSLDETGKKFVIALTYTHRAADEIQDRVQSIGVDTSNLWIGTIHSFCLEWIIRPYYIYAEELKYGFRVIDSMEQETLLNSLCQNHSGSGVTYYDCGYYFNENGYKISSSDTRKHPVIKAILDEYFSILYDRRLIDYEMILNYAYKLIKQNPNISKLLSGLFSIVLVDEYQDTRQLQYLIIGSIIRAGHDSTRLFMVGDPNQSIFQGLGGYPISLPDLRSLTEVTINKRQLSVNYRSEERIIRYFSAFNVHQSTITHFVKEEDINTLITYDNQVDRYELEDRLVNLIQYNIEILGVSPHEICVLAPWWTQLSTITRRLVARLPQYSFDGPGTVPFARDLDNFWYKVSKIALTSASPTMYKRRMRWAREIINDLSAYGLLKDNSLTNKSLLFASNSISISETDGMLYLQAFFSELFQYLGINIDAHENLKLQKDSFILSSTKRVEQLSRDGVDFSDIDSFRRVFKENSGITISTIHGIKGAEFDTVIAFSLLEGMVPHFSDINRVDSAKKLLYVIASRARKNLHLISETGRTRGSFGEYPATIILRDYSFAYDTTL